MQVPEAAGKGKAKVTFSFPDWKEGNVSLSTFEVPVVELTEGREEIECQFEHQ